MVKQSKINRRTLLLGTTAAALGSTLSSCSANAAETLNISLLVGSIPAEVLKKFRQQASSPVKFQTLNQLSGLFSQLQRWQSKQDSGFSLRQLFPWVKDPEQRQPDNLVSLGDYWLTSAIAQNLIEPLQLETTVLEKLPADWLSDWQSLVEQAAKQPKPEQSAVEPTTSSIWAAPYRVQSLVIVYREGAVPIAAGAKPFSSWRDLLSPALQNRIAMPEHPRIVLGILEKIRNGSFNPSIESSAKAPPTVAKIEQQLNEQLGDLLGQLNRQVKTYSAESSLKALINDDVDVAISWSADIVAAQRRYQELKIAIPEEGSLLSTDVWVRPKGAAMSETAKSWISYCWESGPATQISRSGKGLSPVFLGEAATLALPEALANSTLPLETIRKSEPLLPLSPDAQTAYFNFWQRSRTEVP